MSVEKEAAGRRAVDYIESGMVVGLGTGSTTFYFIDELGKRIKSGELQHIVGVSSSTQTDFIAKQRGIELVPLDQVNQIDVTVDGADEALRTFTGIKGGGGALLYEKIIAQNSQKVIWVVGEDKIVEELGAFRLPVEVVQFGCWRLFRNFEEAGMKPTFRKSGEDTLYITDAGNYIIDLHLGSIPNPSQLAFELNNIVGVVEHGIFLNYPETIIIGKETGEVEILNR